MTTYDAEPKTALFGDLEVLSVVRETRAYLPDGLLLDIGPA